jgi:hypothetical protein
MRFPAYVHHTAPPTRFGGLFVGPVPTVPWQILSGTSAFLFIVLVFFSWCLAMREYTLVISSHCEADGGDRELSSFSPSESIVPPVVCICLITGLRRRPPHTPSGVTGMKSDGSSSSTT